MKRYESIGELLIDYRAINNLSQADFAEKLDVDTRTVQRWEKGQTLIKSDKEEEIVVKTLLPYQLVRNLNAAVVIPTFYDFRIRKYSLSEISNEVPDALWFKRDLGSKNKNIRTIDFSFDNTYLIKYLKFQKEVPKNILQAIEKAVGLLPELNFIITDNAGYYSGHSIILPLKEATFIKMKKQELREDQLCESDIVSNTHKETPIFYNYDIAADCNVNLYFMVREMLCFFKKLKTSYIYGGYVFRHDTFKINEQLGLKVVWEDEAIIDKMGIEIFPRFYEGTFVNYLNE
ncbi:helix-turn-helix domain-containing protein [Lutibacter holmesii]|uniref:Helix-turn-helix domain-containing protein n=1 Tax=Lutibacter holmesii TaxID=1137985 RepID=A0ABW3WR61_9FLAO